MCALQLMGKQHTEKAVPTLKKKKKIEEEKDNLPAERAYLGA